ncbi:MAG: hypothetical protein NTY90_00935 [Candidatus Micrarchaeota archaeon]|nr:hypothetical protein [Candidatus Micrarchaeota archaeon]
MVQLGTAVELAAVVLSGIVFIAAYRVFSFFRKTALAKPLMFISAAFYLFFTSIVLGVMEKEFGVNVFYATEAAQALFFTSAAYGLYLFYRVYPVLAEKEARVEGAVEKIEELVVHGLVKRSRRVEAELKILKMRFMKREISDSVFGKVWADKERELVEIQAELQMLKGAKHG